MRQNDIAQLNESSMAAAGFDRSMIAAFRQITKQVSMVAGAISLPEVAANAEQSQVSLDSVNIAVTALQALGAMLEANQAEVRAPDRHAREIAELRSDFEAMQITNNQLARRLATLENGVN